MSLEPSYSDEIEILLRTFEPDQVALYFILRVYASESGGNPNDKLASHLIEKRTDVDGLRNVITSPEDIDVIWARDYPTEQDWRTQSSEPRFGYLAEISDASRTIRGEHMARILIDFVNGGERVFAVVGSGHVIRQEWNLRTVLNQEPSWDQPVVGLAD